METAASDISPNLSSIGSSNDLSFSMDELKHDESIQQKLKPCKNLKSLLKLFRSHKNQRDELIPFLIDVAQDDEDEVFVVLAEQLNDTFIPFVGGVEFSKYTFHLWKSQLPLRKLQLETKAVESLDTLLLICLREQILSGFHSSC